MIIVLCEGQTEERFIKEIIIPAFSQFYIIPKIIMTKGGKKTKRMLSLLRDSIR
jgi:hypothetical protein